MNTLETAQLMHTIHHANKLSEVRRCFPANENEKPIEDNAESNNSKILVIVVGVILLAGVITLVYVYHHKKKKLHDSNN